ncbi:reverse transcriptase [Cooperia oncophora]
MEFKLFPQFRSHRNVPYSSATTVSAVNLISAVETVQEGVDRFLNTKKNGDVAADGAGVAREISGDDRSDHVVTYRMSRSRSASRSSRSSSDSDHSSASSNSQDRTVAGNSRSRSTSRERSVDKGSGRSYSSPLAPPVPDIRIPRRDEFRSAKDEVPAPPAVPQKTLRVRVSISERAAACCLSTRGGTSDRRTAPARQRPCHPHTRTELRTLHETLLNVLNIVELIRKLGSDGQGSAFAASVIGYIEILDTLVSGSLMDLIILRRERFLKALGVEPRRAMPSYRRLPLAGSTMVHHVRQTLIPDLFGKELRDELASADSAITKSLQKLRAQSAKKRKATPPRHSKDRLVSSDGSISHLSLVSISDRESVCKGSAVALSPHTGRIAGRLADFPRSMGDDLGYRIPFGSTKPCLSLPLRQILATPANLADELSLLWKKGVIEKAPLNSEVWVSSMFGIPKKDGSTRPIINLRPLNAYLDIPHFKMDNLHTVADVAFKGDFCAKIDMRDAYFAINISIEHRNYLAFWWDPDSVQIHLLTIRVGNGPYVYTKLMRVVAAHFRARGIRVINYLDDWAFFADTESECRQQVAYAIQFFEYLGLSINLPKSRLIPCQEFEFLGLIIDTGRGEFRIPPSKLEQIQTEASFLVQKRVILARELSAFLGRVNFVAMASPYSTHMTRRLQRELANKTNPLIKESFNNTIALEEETNADLLWFRDNLSAYASHPFTHFSPDTSIVTDASKRGWGAVCNGRRTGGRWSEQEATCHINVLELLAALFGLQSFGDKWKEH